MKRLGATVVGLTFGLLVSWACLYSFSHIHWPVPGRPETGCYMIEDCSSSWWTYPLFFLTLLGPTVAFGLVNAVAWKRWTLRKWAITYAILAVTTALLYLAGYLLPLFR